MMSEIVEYLQTDWSMGYSGIIGYLNTISHILDHQRSTGRLSTENLSVFIASEIYLQRVKKFLAKMGVEWNSVLTVDLSFATTFVVAVLFLLVKTSRPMTYQYLTVPMFRSVNYAGIIDQT